ncbi:MAG: hypothetical protein QW328_08715 [Nitrososphaerota archaeon]
MRSKIELAALVYLFARKVKGFTGIYDYEADLEYICDIIRLNYGKDTEKELVNTYSEEEILRIWRDTKPHTAKIKKMVEGDSWLVGEAYSAAMQLKDLYRVMYERDPNEATFEFIAECLRIRNGDKAKEIIEQLGEEKLKEIWKSVEIRYEHMNTQEEDVDKPLIIGPRKYKVNLAEIYRKFPNKYVHEIEKTLGVSRGTLARWKKNPVVSLKMARKIARLVPRAIEPLDGETKT